MQINPRVECKDGQYNAYLNLKSYSITCCNWPHCFSVSLTVLFPDWRENFNSYIETVLIILSSTFPKSFHRAKTRFYSGCGLAGLVRLGSNRDAIRKLCCHAHIFRPCVAIRDSRYNKA